MKGATKTKMEWKRDLSKMKMEVNFRKLIIDAKTKDIGSYHKTSITFQVSRSVTLSKLRGSIGINFEVYIQSVF